MRAATDDASGFRRWGRAACGAVATATIILVAPAQESGPIVIGERPKLESVHFDDVRLALDFLGIWQRDETTSGGETLRDTEQRFRETLEITTNGYFGHPNLVIFDMTGRFGLEQQEIESDTFGMSDRTSQTLLEYNLLFDLFRETKLPITLYGQQDQVLQTRQFGPSLDSLTSEFGGIFTLRSDFAPTRLQIFHREQDQSSPLDDLDFRLVQDTVAASGQLNFTPSHFLTWDYTFDDVSESGTLRPTNSFQRHDAFITDSLSFGTTDEHNLRSSLHYLTQNGDFPIDRLRWTESLILRHTRDLETRYDYSFDRQAVEGSTQTLHLGTARLTHRLFDSLVTTAELGASALRASEGDFTSDQVFGALGLEYTKRVPYGLLTATTNFRYAHQEDSERGGELFIVDEVRVFGSSGIIFIERQFIVPGSIVITSLDGLIVYQEGADYTVTVFDDRAEIRRLLGGDIAENQPVLIDYRIGPEPGGTIDTMGIGGTIRYRFDEGALTGLSIYSRYFEQIQDRSTSSMLDVRESDFRDLVFGAEYDIWRLFFKGEYQIRSGSFSPYDALRLEAYYTHPFGVGSSLVISAVHHEIDRTDEDIQTTIDTLSGAWNQQLTDRLRAKLLLVWREESDSASIDVTAFEQQFELSWNYKQTMVYGSVRNAFIESDVNDSAFQSFVLGVRREF